MNLGEGWDTASYARQLKLKPAVDRAIEHVRKAFYKHTPRIVDSFFYGSIGKDPKSLVIYYVYTTDAQKNEAKHNGTLQELKQKTHDALQNEDYPKDDLSSIYVCFASEEEIKRDRNFFR